MRGSVAHDRALIDRWKPSVGPVFNSQHGQLTRIDQCHEGGQVIGFRPQTVGQPASQGRPTLDDPSSLQSANGLAVIIDSGPHPSDQANVIGHRRGVRNQFGKLHPAGTASFEFPRGREYF